MSSADVVAVVMFAAVVLYAVFGGADFGSGVWDLLAGGPERGARTRRLIDHSIGPVWEANHVWLVFVLVFLWTGFPRAFATIMRELSVPFWLVGLGIVLRGSGFAFRRYAPDFRWARVYGVTFALSSMITPFFMGTIAGAIASGRIGDGADDGVSWLSPTAVLGGVLAVATCSFLASVYLVSEAQALGSEDLVADLRPRTLASGVIAGAIALVGVVPLLADADTLAKGLTGRALPVVALSAVAGVASLVLLWHARYALARWAAAVAVAAVVAGWGIGQYPWILVDTMTIDDAAGAPATLTGLVIATGLAAVLVVPPLVYLLALANKNIVGSEA